MAKLPLQVFNKFVKLPNIIDGQAELATTVVTTLKYLQSWPMARTPFKSRFCYGLVFLYCNIIMIGLWGHIIKLCTINISNTKKLSIY